MWHCPFKDLCKRFRKWLLTPRGHERISGVMRDSPGSWETPQGRIPQVRTHLRLTTLGSRGFGRLSVNRFSFAYSFFSYVLFGSLFLALLFNFGLTFLLILVLFVNSFFSSNLCLIFLYFTNVPSLLYFISFLFLCYFFSSSFARQRYKILFFLQKSYESLLYCMLWKKLLEFENVTLEFEKVMELNFIVRKRNTNPLARKLTHRLAS